MTVFFWKSLNEQSHFSVLGSIPPCRPYYCRPDWNSSMPVLLVKIIRKQCIIKELSRHNGFGLLSIRNIANVLLQNKHIAKIKKKLCLEYIWAVSSRIVINTLLNYTNQNSTGSNDMCTSRYFNNVVVPRGLIFKQKYFPTPTVLLLKLFFSLRKIVSGNVVLGCASVLRRTDCCHRKWLWETQKYWVGTANRRKPYLNVTSTRL